MSGAKHSHEEIMFWLGFGYGLFGAFLAYYHSWPALAFLAFAFAGNALGRIK